MSKYAYVLLGIAFTIVISLAWLLLSKNDRSSEVNPSSTYTPDVYIDMTDHGFSLTEISIRQGQTVAFRNSDSGFHWPASDLHPTHEIYSAFDPRQPIAPGEIWAFTFDKVGEWRFHDHLHPSKKGVITVSPL